MQAIRVSRYVGGSGVRVRDADVCAPLRNGGGGGGGGGNGGVCNDNGLPLSDNGQACAGIPHDTWRCACSGRFETSVSQVCRDGRWLNFELNPSDCSRCDGRYTRGCAP
jgi:hypothetical protein